jgi:hypothetical protein
MLFKALQGNFYDACNILSNCFRCLLGKDGFAKQMIKSLAVYQYKFKVGQIGHACNGIRLFTAIGS